MSADGGRNPGEARDPLDAIIREVAIRHGYTISRDDPILMTYTINQQLMQAGARIQQGMLEAHHCRMEEISQDLQDQAAGRLDRVSCAALESMRLALRQEAESLFSQYRKESEALNRLVVEHCLQWRRFAMVAMAVSILTLAAALVVLSVAA